MFNVDTDKTGIRAIFRDYEVIALKVIEEAGIVYIDIREIFEEANQRMKDRGLSTLSRATYYGFVRDLADHDLLETREETGRGGKHDTFRLKSGGMVELKTEVSKRIIQSVINAFPELDFGEIISGLEQRALF